MFAASSELSRHYFIADDSRLRRPVVQRKEKLKMKSTAWATLPVFVIGLTEREEGGW